jgi:hypothetical protein
MGLDIYQSKINFVWTFVWKHGYVEYDFCSTKLLGICEIETRSLF